MLPVVTEVSTAVEATTASMEVEDTAAVAVAVVAMVGSTVLSFRYPLFLN